MTELTSLLNSAILTGSDYKKVSLTDSYGVDAAASLFGSSEDTSSLNSLLSSAYSLTESDLSGLNLDSGTLNALFTSINSNVDSSLYAASSLSSYESSLSLLSNTYLSNTDINA